MVLDTMIAKYLTRWETGYYCRGLVRIVVAPETAPVTFADFLASPHVTAAYVRKVQASPHTAHRALWRLSYVPVRRSQWTAVQLFDPRVDRWRDFHELVAPGAGAAAYDLDSFAKAIPPDPIPVPIDPVPVSSGAMLFRSLVSISRQPVPVAPSDAGLAPYFDRLADVFDDHLTGLRYLVPVLLSELLTPLGLAGLHALDVLDLGCGTGLMARIVAPYARRLVGVDLSAGMLAKARGRGYHELIQADMVEYLRFVSQAFDVIVAADVLPYVATLDEFVSCATAALRPGGAILFTVEEGTDVGHDVVRTSSGRYVHTFEYVDRVLTAAHLRPEIIRAPLRLEAGVPVRGLVVRAIHANDPVAVGPVGRDGRRG